MRLAKYCDPRRHSELVWCLRFILIRLSNSMCVNTHSFKHSSLQGNKLVSLWGQWCPLQLVVGTQATWASWLLGLQDLVIAAVLPLAWSQQERADETAHVLYRAQREPRWWEMSIQPTWLWGAWEIRLAVDSEEKQTFGEHRTSSKGGGWLGWVQK